jgi:probable phosphoglycerate mutase
MELLLIRHALPVRLHNPDGTPADPPLSDEGRAQAERLAGWLEGQPLDALYSSPLRRALETAAPLARVAGLEPRVEPGVAEFDQYAESYVPLEELKATDYARWKALVDHGFYLEGDAETFRRTVVESLERVIVEHPGGCVAVVCHGGVINAWASHLLGLERLFLFEPAYTSVNRFLAASSGERTLVSLNEHF